MKVEAFDTIENSVALNDNRAVGVPILSPGPGRGPGCLTTQHLGNFGSKALLPELLRLSPSF